MRDADQRSVKASCGCIARDWAGNGGNKVGQGSVEFFSAIQASEYDGYRPNTLTYIPQKSIGANHQSSTTRALDGKRMAIDVVSSPATS